ncbi:hypothetical protein B0T14DRAFT_526658 [Immersiella caudata]|uniref:Uncharacterized protein n=1 Tax=Immersiella caudata TaxID=314043 RepID=A0AA39WE06_9PEZI|nr:hypothetical protein B0T14DRAFT_526658 [Immersiella caudata]
MSPQKATNSAGSNTSGSPAPTPTSTSSASPGETQAMNTVANNDNSGIYSTMVSTDERSMSDGTLHGRLMGANGGNPQIVPSAYSRISVYCVRAARIIDEFEKVFEQGR